MDPPDPPKFVACFRTNQIRVSHVKSRWPVLLFHSVLQKTMFGFIPYEYRGSRTSCTVKLNGRGWLPVSIEFQAQQDIVIRLTVITRRHLVVSILISFKRTIPRNQFIADVCLFDSLVLWVKIWEMPGCLRSRFVSNTCNLIKQSYTHDCETVSDHDPGKFWTICALMTAHSWPQGGFLARRHLQELISPMAASPLPRYSDLAVPQAQVCYCLVVGNHIIGSQLLRHDVSTEFQS